MAAGLPFLSPNQTGMLYIIKIIGAKILAIFLHITKEKAERPFLFYVLFPFHLIGKECRSGFQEHGDAFVLAIGTCAYPMLLELF